MSSLLFNRSPVFFIVAALSIEFDTRNTKVRSISTKISLIFAFYLLTP